ncbi:unnamed protein product [Rhodiola kirilowii]
MSKPVVKTESVVTIDPTMMIGSDDEDDDQKAMKKPGSSLLVKSKVAAVRCCQADKCGADLATAKPYHKRHKVCEVHAKAQVVLVNGIRQRFCQQCSRFHEVSEFDESKRSCRRRLAGHNERRRKSPAADHDSHQGHEMSSSRKAGMVMWASQ